MPLWGQRKRNGQARLEVLEVSVDSEPWEEKTGWLGALQTVRVLGALSHTSTVLLLLAFWSPSLLLFHSLPLCLVPLAGGCWAARSKAC